MRSDLTDITVVLDRSGSMATVENDTKGGFDKFVQDQKSAPGDANLTLVQFDTVYEFVHSARPIRDIPPLSFQPRGGTALLDAIGRAIKQTGERLKLMDESLRPAKVVFVILTDGEENSSQEYSKKQINEMISHQQNAYKWQFVFLGANQDAIKEASDLGINIGNAMTYAHTAKGMNAAFSATSANLAMYRSGVSTTMNYSEKQKEEAVTEK